MKKMLGGVRRRFGVVATLAMYWISGGRLSVALTLLFVGNVAVAGSIVFYRVAASALVSEQELDRVSSAGYAIGYLGGGVLLAINVAMIQRPAGFGIADTGTAVRLSLASVRDLVLVFSIPLFRRVPEPPRRIEPGDAPNASLIGTGARRLVEHSGNCGASNRRS